MGAAKHTPGPWRYTRDRQVRTGDSDGTRFGGELIASIGWQVPEAPANARLIAAAPEMLEALSAAERKLIEIKNSGLGISCLDEIVEAQNAIAKATGEAS